MKSKTMKYESYLNCKRPTNVKLVAVKNGKNDP